MFWTSTKSELSGVWIKTAIILCVCLCVAYNIWGCKPTDYGELEKNYWLNHCYLTTSIKTALVLSELSEGSEVCQGTETDVHQIDLIWELALHHLRLPQICAKT